MESDLYLNGCRIQEIFLEKGAESKRIGIWISIDITSDSLPTYNWPDPDAL